MTEAWTETPASLQLQLQPTRLAPTAVRGENPGRLRGNGGLEWMRHPRAGHVADPDPSTALHDSRTADRYRGCLGREHEEERGAEEVGGAGDEMRDRSFHCSSEGRRL